MSEHTEPENAYLLIDNEYWDGNKFVSDGLIVIPVSDYANWCSNSFPTIHRVSLSREILEQFRRGEPIRKTRSDKGVPRGSRTNPSARREKT